MENRDLFGDLIVERGRGRPQHQRTRETAALVRRLAIAKHTLIEIAEQLGVSKPTLVRHYRDVAGPGPKGRRSRARGEVRP